VNTLNIFYRNFFGAQWRPPTDL